MLVVVALLLPTLCVGSSVSWWFECGNNASIDAANVAALAKLRPSAVTRVMPDFDYVKGDKEGPVDGHGYGIMYHMYPDELRFCATCYSPRQSTVFLKELERALEDVAKLLGGA